MTEPKVVRHSCWCSNKELDPVEMVRYSDYARLAARVQELEAGVLLSEAGNRVLEVEADDLIAENKRLRKALGEYGHHKPRCKIDPCDCGILEALKEKP